MGDHKTITIKDIAKEAGVGVGTISRVLNNDSHVSSKTREKVEEAMERLDYRPNAFARGLKSNNSYSIGVIVADVTNPVFAKVIRGIEDPHTPSLTANLACSCLIQKCRKKMYTRA